MFPLFLQRITTRSIGLVGTRLWGLNNPLLSQSFRTRRTFLTTPSVSIPAKKATSDGGKGKGKVKAKGTGKGKAKAKETGKGKKKVAAAATSATKKKPAKKRDRPTRKTVKVVKLPKLKKADLKPLKRPMTPYFIYLSGFMREQMKESPDRSLKMANSLAKEASRRWHNFSDEEKQPFNDTYASTLEAFQVRKREYFDNVEPSSLLRINKERVRRGMCRIKMMKKETEFKRPTGSFLKFLDDYRRTSEGLALKNPGELGRAAAVQWRGLSPEKKSEYDTRTQLEFKTWYEKIGKQAPASKTA